MTSRSIFSPAFQRRLAKTALRRHPPNLRSLHTTSLLLGKHNLAPREMPPPTALSALLSRLSLPPNPALHAVLVSCLTHPSYNPLPTNSTGTTSSETTTESEAPHDIESNELLCALGNSLLGLFASEHLAHLYPLLPTEALKSAVTAYVGPKACFSVARELGVGVQAGGNTGAVGQGPGMISAGVALRWTRTGERERDGAREQPERTPVAKRFRKYVGDEAVGGEDDKAWHRTNKKESFEEIIATSVKAFVGLIYQEQGIHAARSFTHAHFLTRHLELASLFNFKNPKHVLASVVSRHLLDAGVPAGNGMGRVEARLLASTGEQTQSPLFNIGLFTSFGLKLGEGHGSTKAMAEHRAAVNALLAHFLVRGDQRDRRPSSPTSTSSRSSSSLLPTSAHTDFPVDENGPVAAEGEEYVGTGLGGGGGGGGGGETVVESSKRLSRGGRYGVQKAPSDTKVRVPRVTKSPVEGRMRGQTA